MIHFCFTDERKFARYFDVEARIIPVSKESNYCLDVKRIRENLDENTIGISLPGSD
jgi:glutamate decarboxylase